MVATEGLPLRDGGLASSSNGCSDSVNVTAALRCTPPRIALSAVLSYPPASGRVGPRGMESWPASLPFWRRRQ